MVQQSPFRRVRALRRCWTLLYIMLDQLQLRNIELAAVHASERRPQHAAAVSRAAPHGT